MHTVLLLASLLCGPKYSNFFTFLLLIFLQFIYFKQTQAHFFASPKIRVSLSPSLSAPWQDHEMTKAELAQVNKFEGFS